MSVKNILSKEAIEIIQSVLYVSEEMITDISVLENGMTNYSFVFSCEGERYIIRLPGEGTSKLINRTQEAAVYKTIMGEEICDEIVYMNPINGYKLAKYIPNARICDPYSVMDLQKCMHKLKEFHERQFVVGHVFDLFERLEYYQGLWNAQSRYCDYERTKQNVLSMKAYIEAQDIKKSLCHIDAVYTNFLIYETESGEEKTCLIDWEYAAMQDPHIDIAMFCIYALYDREQIERLIDIYFVGQCDSLIRRKIYAYIAICGLIWSNWCEYKYQLGVDFGEYARRQYEYAKEYYTVWREMEHRK